MRTIQKLEFISGVFTFLFALLNVYPNFISFAYGFKDSNEQLLFGKITFLIIPASLVIIGAIFHTIKKWKTGFLMIFVGGMFLTLTHTLGFLLGQVLSVHHLFGGFFAFTTIILAFFNLILTLSNSKELSTR
jgi:hypothetical protein